MKVILKLLLLVGLAAYLVFAFVKFNRSKDNTVCNKVSVVITDKERANFVSEEDVRQILKDAKISPEGKKMADVSLLSIKRAVDGHQFVLHSTCYSRPDGEVVIEVSQKLPVLRVMPSMGEGYYIDADGNKIKHVDYPADVIVVTGNVNYNKNKKYLTTFAQIIQHDEFWSDMIEQINVTPDGNIELAPRLGDHIVALGKPQDIGLKLSHLKTFYEKVINEVGWNKYSRISLEYNNQVVCTKRDVS